MKNRLLIWLLIACGVLAICSFAVIPLFHAGLFTMHDDEQVARLQQMYLVISQGQIPPRWIPDLGFGFGYPLFNFYPPLVYYVGSLIHFLGFSFIDSTKIVFGLGFVLAALAMFLWVRKHYGIIPGLFAAILYTYAPYHSVDSYVRGALSEFFSWIFIPLILLAIDLLIEKKEKKYIVLLGILFGLLMLSHTLVMLQFGPLLLVYLGFLFFQKRNRNFTMLMQLLLGLGLGLGLTAYFWLPSILEKQYTLVDAILTKELASYAIHFVCPIQLWSGIWGYGGSAAGCLDGLSFQIGKVQTIIGSLGVILSILFLFKRRLLVSIGSAVLFLCSIFLVLPYSKFLWDVATPFWYIQFPWRYLLFVAVFSAFLGGFVLFLVQKRFGTVIAIVLGLSLSLVAVFQVRNYFQPQAYRMVTDKDMVSLEELQVHVSGLSYEYVPKEEPTMLSPQKTTELVLPTYGGVDSSSYGYPPSNMKVVEVENKSYLKKYIVRVYNTKLYNSAIFQVNTFIFPGWTVYVDGKEQKKLIDNYFHVIQVELPAGRHEVTVKFNNTPIRVIASGISLVTIGILMTCLFLFKRKKQ